jgi:hypothetical protein
MQKIAFDHIVETNLNYRLFHGRKLNKVKYLDQKQMMS